MKWIKAVLFSILPDCDRVVKMHWLGVYDSLRAKMRPGYLLHLMVCGPCRKYGHQIRQLRRQVGKDPEAPDFNMEYRLKPEAKERLKGRVREEMQGSTGNE